MAGQRARLPAWSRPELDQGYSLLSTEQFDQEAVQSVAWAEVGPDLSVLPLMAFHFSFGFRESDVIILSAGSGCLLHPPFSLEAPESTRREKAGQAAGLNLLKPHFHHLQENLVAAGLFRGFDKKKYI